MRDLCFKSGNFRHRKVFARTGCGTNVAMADNVSGGDAVFGFERLHESFDGGALRFRGMVRFKVPHEAHADAVLVVIFIRRSGVRAVELLLPAKRRLDRAVAHAVAVADDKVIANPQPRVAFAVFVVEV